MTASAPASEGRAAFNDGVRLQWYEHGSGEPLLLIMGLGGSSRAWFRMLPHLDGRVRAVVFDNRGTGGSDGTGPRLTLDDMVADTLAVMDAAGLQDAHILGVSMGGMIAQRLALDHRDRVRSLVLGCTTASARGGLPPWRLIAGAAVRAIAPDQATALLVPALYSRTTRGEAPHRIAEDLEMRRVDQTPAQTIFAQMIAVGAHSVGCRLAELDGLPVTVVHGDEDALISVERGRELARLIPGARMVEVPGAGHVLLTDSHDVVTRAIDAHLQSVGALAAVV